MADERHPLLIIYSPPHQRRRHQSTCGRFLLVSTTATLIFLGALLVYQAVIAACHDGHHHHRPRRHGHCHWHRGHWPFPDDDRLGHRANSSQSVGVAGDSPLGSDNAQIKRVIMDTPSTTKIDEWATYYMSGPHLAGQNYSQAEWTQNLWSSWGVPSHITPYEVYLNYHVDHALSLLTFNENTNTWDTTFNASLEEDVITEDPTSGAPDRVPTFHGYSASGHVTAPYVYVNYGSYQDFQDLVGRNISLQGKIAIARYGVVFRGLKVLRAQQLGMAGVLLYTDPGDDGEITEFNGHKPYPEGPARHPSSVQRGAVANIGSLAGDPTTPGYPSKPGVPRQDPGDKIPHIPSLPISYLDAIPLLRALNGHGPGASDINQWWTRNLGLGHKGVDYNIGPTPDTIAISLFNQQRYATTPIWDVIGIVNGTGPADDVVVVGNHRDAWIVGGADPNSGSAVLNEVVRAFGLALSRGWRPRRTIIFASWDGEEYGLLGSSEWVEEYAPWLRDAGIAYVNTDVGVSGSRFRAEAVPLLHALVHDITTQVPSANQTVPGQSVHDLWSKAIAPPGSGSDFVAFQDFVGIPSVDFGFMKGPTDPVYMYHSNFDSLHWIKKFGDPGFRWHQAASRILGLTALALADRPVIPFSALDYAVALDSYLDRTEQKLAGPKHDAGFSSRDVGTPTGEEETAVVRGRSDSSESQGSVEDLRHKLSTLRDAIARFKREAEALDERAASARRHIEQGIPWWNPWGRLMLDRQIRRTNEQYKKLERAFLYEGGLDARENYKHVVVAPDRWTGYTADVFPGLVESIDSKNFTNGVKWAGIIRDCVDKAVETIQV